MKILFIGPQGAGKSTQAKMLAEYSSIPYISTGDIFRKIANDQSQEGSRIREVLLSGNLVDDETVSELVEKRLKDNDCAVGFILDGYPRSLKQIEYYDPGFERVIYLKLEDSVAVKRLLDRGREDDTLELIRQRLKLYHTQTDPILNYYEQKNLLHTIDASGSVENVQEEVRKVING